MSKLKLRLVEIAIVVSLLLSFSVSLAGAQDDNSVVTQVFIPVEGSFIGSAEGLGVSYKIQGTSGATGTITTSVTSENPEPNAFIPAGKKVSHFVAIDFDIALSLFDSAIVTVSYSDTDVLGIEEPYALYKYLPMGFSFVDVPAGIDYNAKTITFTLSSSTEDVLFAIGGTNSDAVKPMSFTSWAIMIGCFLVIALLIIFGIWYFRKPSHW